MLNYFFYLDFMGGDNIKNKIKTIIAILLIIISIKGFVEFIREEPISTKVETVTILDVYHDVMLHDEDFKVKIDTHDGVIHVIYVNKNVFNYCESNIGKDVNLTIQRTKLVHWIWNSEMLRIVNY
jgi:hypothetical protein